MRSIFPLVAVVGLAIPASAQIVTNGNFETGALPPWVFIADANAEPLMVATVAMFQNSQMFRVNPGNSTGGTGGSAGGNLEQSVTLQMGTTYTVSGDLYIQNITGSNNANGGTIDVRINGQSVHSWTVNTIPAMALETHPFSVQYAATSSGPQPLTLRLTRTFRNSSPSIYHWADNITILGGSTPCYANCDGSTITPVLNVNDFTCFLNRYAAGDSYANCDASTIPPVLNVNDFTCFLNAYAAGCP